MLTVMHGIYFALHAVVKNVILVSCLLSLSLSPLPPSLSLSLGCGIFGILRLVMCSREVDFTAPLYLTYILLYKVSAISFVLSFLHFIVIEYDGKSSVFVAFE